MARFALFEGSYAARYNNAMHAAYHTAEYKVLDTRGTLEERVHVTAAKMLEYKNYVDELNERTKEATASVDTLETTAQESERDRLLSLLFVLTASGLVSLDAAVKAAAQLLDIVIRPYKGIQNQADDTETGLIRNLILDLRKEENAAAVKTLNLENIIESLEAANEAFDRTKASRVQAKYARKLQMTTEDLRKLADETLLEIQDAIRASGIIASLTTGQEDTVTFVNQLMQEMNAVTSNFKTSYNQSEAQKKVNKEEDDAPAPSTPPEGENPDGEKPGEETPEDPIEGDENQYQPIG